MSNGIIAYIDPIPKITMAPIFCARSISNRITKGVGSKNKITSVMIFDTAVAMYSAPASRHDPWAISKSNALRTGLQWKNMMAEMTTV